MVRVLHVLGRTDVGGAENVIMELYRHIDRTKVQFDFAVHTEDHCAYDDEIKSLGGHIYRVPAYSILNTSEYKRAWRKLLLEHPECAVIHSHVRSSAVFYLPEAAKLGRYTIIHSHNTSSGSGIQGLAKNILQFPLRHMADYYMACSRESGVWLFGKKVCSSGNFGIMRNAIDPSDFMYNTENRRRLRDELGLKDSFVVGNVGCFKEQKNHRLIMNVFRKICDRYDNSKLMLVGDGELKAGIAAMAKKLGIADKVIFTGMRGDVNELFSAMDLFLLPSLYEGFSVALLEAQCAGLPILASRNAVADEAKLSPLIEIHELTDSPDVWADRALELYRGVARESGEKYITDGGYDINDTYIKMQNFYLEKAAANTDGGPVGKY